jgi:hypothetical protein
MQLLLGNRDRSRECETRTKQNSRGGLGGTRTTLSGYTHTYVSNLYNIARVGDGDDAGKSRCVLPMLLGGDGKRRRANHPLTSEI